MLRLMVCCWMVLLSVFASVSSGAEKPADPARFEDPLPPQAVARLGTVRFADPHLLNCSHLSYSPDGKYLSGGGALSVTVWDAQSGHKIFQPGTGGDLGNRAVTFSPNNKFLAICFFHFQGERGDLSLWNVTPGKKPRYLMDQEELWEDVCSPENKSKILTEQRIEAVGFSPDSKILASADSTQGIRLWDTQTGKQTRILPCQIKRGRKAALAFSLDGKILHFVDAEGKLSAFDLATGKQSQQQLKLPSDVATLEFSPDRTVLAVISKGSIELYSLSTLKHLHQLKVEQGKLNSMTFFPDGKTLVASGTPWLLCSWDVNSGNLIRKFSAQYQPTTVAVTPDGKTIACSVGSDAQIYLCDAQTGDVRGPRGDNVMGPLEQVMFLADGKTIVTLSDRSARVWPQGHGKESHPLNLPESTSRVLCPERSALVVHTAEKNLLTLDLPSCKEVQRCPSGVGDALLLKISANRGRIAICDTESKKDSISVLDLTTGKQIINWGDGGPSLSADGRLAACVQDGEWRLWDLGSKKNIWHEKFDEDIWPFDSFFSPDGHTILILGRVAGVRLFETATGKVRLRPNQEIYPSVACFSPDGQTVALGGREGQVWLWSLGEPRQLHLFHGHKQWIGSLHFSPDGSRLVSGSYDTTALIWDVPAAYRNPKPKPAQLTPDDSTKVWSKLASADATVAYAAILRLAAAQNQAVNLCQTRLFETDKTTPEQVQRWIGQLDAEDYQIREQGSLNLERVENAAKNQLEGTLKEKCSAEMKRRIEVLLETLNGKNVGVRPLRAVELLEMVGTTEAVDVLRQIEKKTGDVRIREEVKASLRRLAEQRRFP